MSQWNNSYSYNNQYQGHSTWNGDMSAQYINQAYFSDPNRQYNPSNQYVSFNEFLAQMQSAGVPTAMPTNIPPANSMSYNNIQYQNYSNNQYNYQNVPSQNAQIDYSYGSNTTNIVAPLSVEQDYQVSTQHPQQHQYEADLAGTSKYNEMVFNSKLTPTATEFVPKNCGVDTSGSSNSISQPSKPSTSKNSIETVNVCNSSIQNKPSTSETNWRERPQIAQSNGSSNVEENFDRQMKNFRGQYKNSSNGYNENSNQNTDVSSQKQDVYYRSQESGKHNYDTNSYNHDRNNSKNAIESNSDNSETSTRYQDRNRRNESNSYQRSNNRQFDSNNYNHDNQNRNSDGNYQGDGGSSKPNSKQNNKNKETDARMFYNSSMPKGSQDVRNGKGDGSGRRGWAGSQRVRATERNNVEDEQYANTYLQYRENKLSKEPKASPVRNKNKNGTNHGNVTAYTEMTQRERLSEQLDKGTLECLVCCERVKQIDSVWWCSNCYHVLHLKCIRKWALSSVIEGKWRCPACQNPSSDIPTEYRCMCGAVRNPEYQRGSSGAHTCGRACQRPRTCPHPCTLLCHPGPCPPCQATVNKYCGCGTETRMVLCSSKLPQVCGRQCQKKLECDVHTCKKDCHEGPCEECVETVTQVCHCSVSKTRVVACTRGVTADWTCGAECGRILGCGAHVCRRVCHPPPCAPCPLRPESVLACPCGKMRIKKGQRKLCTDPIPLCDNICAKPLRCGPEEERHFCKEKCHEGECPVCPDSTHLQCRCGHSTREVPCKDLPTVANNITCQRKCNKKLSCGRHRCREVCCDGNEHMCAVVCGRSLFCQQHRCEEYCHAGHCAPCPRLNFDEVRCECGESVLLPPVRCGARPPACTAPCIRPRPCGHPPHHSCHTDECPPCVVLTTRVCHGGHEERKTIPCSQEEFSCGLPCGKPLPCGKHTCIKVCHKGPCDTGKCTQPCTEKRPSCGHPCAAACHSGTGSACPSAAPCRRSVRATCPCGRRSAERACADNARDLARIMSTLAVSKMQEGGSVDLSDVQRPVNMLKTLECDDECRQEARSRQLALALQIRNPDVSAKLAPRYSEHVRATCAREPAFAHHVHERLTELVQRAKSSKQKTRSHSFPSMNRQKRQFIHEMCEHFGCESVAYDAEPNRNVVATADREKSWLPAMSVMEVLAREAGKRRVPGPVLRAPAAATSTAAATPAATGAAPKSTGGWATLTATNAWAARSARSAQQQQSQQSQPQQHQQQQQQQQAVAPKIDYFDNPPDN